MDEKELQRAAEDFIKNHAEGSFKAGVRWAEKYGEPIIASHDDNGFVPDVILEDEKFKWEQRQFELIKAAVNGMYSKVHEEDIAKMHRGVSKDLITVTSRIIEDFKKSLEK